MILRPQTNRTPQHLRQSGNIVISPIADYAQALNIAKGLNEIKESPTVDYTVSGVAGDYKIIKYIYN